jgi:UDP-2-acetamido-2-deoxy-ribo-hexuluronate aminotransferase
VKYVDLAAQQKRIKTQVDLQIQKVLSHGQYILGPEVSELENKLASYVGVDHCIGVSSGTDALLIALMALGVKPGSEVITTAFAFFATAEMIMLIGARPVFVDIWPDTFNIDANLIENAITEKTSAIMPVNLYGQCADYNEINAVAKKHGLPVIEDAAQSFGATYMGRKSCSLSTIGCTSFFPTKPLGCYGDGGACFTDDDGLQQAMREILKHGQSARYHHTRLGINGRLDTLQAAILLAKMKIFEEEIVMRQQVAGRYDKLLTDAMIENDNPVLEVPYIHSHNVSAYAQYTVKVKGRARIQRVTRKHEVPTAVHYPRPINQHDVMSEFKSPTKVADECAKRVLSLPMHPYLQVADQEKVVQAIFAK